MKLSIFIERTILSGTFVWMFIFSPCYAQVENENSIVMEEIVERNSTSEEQEVDLTELTESINELLDHPLNINKVSAHELRDVGFFTEIQIRNLYNHIERFGKLIAVAELQVVEGFDETFIRQISPYITVGREIDEPNATLMRMINEGKHQIILRTQWIPQERKGFANTDEGPAYLGNPHSIYLRYKFNFMKKLSWGFTAEKDAGEQFFKGAQKQGFDFYSMHLAVRDVGPFKMILIGDYQLSYGQGLTLWTGMSGGKATDPAMIRKSGKGIIPYSSANEVYFKRGACFSLKKKKFQTDFFFSMRKMDGNLQQASDTLSSEEYLTSFQESGYHRTESEIADKNAVTEILYGSHVGYQKRNVQIGLTGVHMQFSLPLTKELKPYNQFEFSGTSLTNLGVDYSWLYRNINFYGETGINTNGKIATVNGLLMSLDSRLVVSVVFRNYPRDFKALYSSALRESGNNFNETGIYSSAAFKPHRTVTITSAYDKFNFPWLRYRTDAPSNGYEFSGMVTYQPSRGTQLYVRYRESNKMQNSSEEDILVSYLVPVKQNGIRFHISTKVSKSFTFRTRIEFVHYKKESTNDKGFMIFQDVQFHPMGTKWSCNTRYALFDSDSYDARMYAYENDVLYGYSIPAYYYKGSRFYVNFRYKIVKGLDAWFRYAATFYSNRTVIGSGMDEIQGSTKSEFKIQIRVEF